MKIRKMFASLVLTTLTIGGVGTALPAQAATDVVEPQLSDIKYGESSFEAADKVQVTSELELSGEHKVYLNVQTEPMTKNQIKAGSCRKAPVGKWYFNEVIDPVTGKHVYKWYPVKAGDNTFCMDRKGVWHKKSCGNKAKGIFGVPKPPKPLRVKGKGVIQDYVDYVASLRLNVSKSGSALAYVKTDTCEARATVDNTVVIQHTASLNVRSRTVMEASAQGEGDIKIMMKNDQKFEADMAAAVYLSIKGEASALCKSTTPPPTPPVHDECPDIPGDQPKGYECTKTPPPPPPVDNPPTMVCTVPEHIFVGDDTMDADFDITDPDGDPVSFNEPVLTGPIEMTTTDLVDVPGGKRFTVSFRAMDIPAGTSQTATIKMTGSAGGKPVSCSGSVIVENGHTGW